MVTDLVDWRLLYAVRSDAGAMITCTCTILRYAITLEFQSLCYNIISSLKTAGDLSAGECQLPSSNAPDGFLTKKLPSNLVLSRSSVMSPVPWQLASLATSMDGRSRVSFGCGTRESGQLDS